MKNKFYRLTILAMLLPFFALGQNEKGIPFTIKGSLKNMPDVTEVAVNYVGLSEYTSESIMVKRGKYKIEGVMGRPGVVSIRTNNQQVDGQALDYKRDMMSIYIAETASITVKSINNLANKSVIGSPWQEEYEELIIPENEYWEKKNKWIAEEYPEYSTGLTEERRNVYTAANKQMADELAKNLYIPFVKKHSSSLVALEAIASYARDEDDPENIDALFQLLPEKSKNSYAGKSLAEKIYNLKQIQNGKIAPDFTLKSSTGETISLASYRGKYLILDFTKGTGCPPCMEQLPFLKRAYKNYKDKGLEILGIQMCSEKWMEEEIKDLQKNEIPWTTVFDMMDEGLVAYNLYAIHGTAPTIFLLGPGGEIISNDIRGSVLERKLAEIFE